MTNTQVPWTDAQWARVEQVIQEQASHARVAATFLPLYGPLPADTDFVRTESISYAEPGIVRTAARNEVNAAFLQYNAALLAGNYPNAAAAQERIARAEAILQRRQMNIDDRNTIQLATLQVRVPVRAAQMADPEMVSVLTLFRRATNVLARIEDAVVFNGLRPNPRVAGRFSPPAGARGLQGIWEILGGQSTDGLWSTTAPRQYEWFPSQPIRLRGERLVRAVSSAIGRLEANGYFGPFAAVFGQGLFLIAQTPDPGTLVLPQDRIIPFLGGGSLLRSSTLEALNGFSGLLLALGNAPVELVVATDVSLQFLQLSAEPWYLFRVSEKMALRIKEAKAIIQIIML